MACPIDQIERVCMCVPMCVCVCVCVCVRGVGGLGGVGANCDDELILWYS